jgi:hypothetical protein
VSSQDRAVLIYSSSRPDFEKTVEETRRNAVASNHLFELVDPTHLSPSEEDRLLTDIRAPRPQARGQVKSGGGRTLPITHSGKLNRSIPILIIYRGSKPTNVFPNDLQGLTRGLNVAFEPTKGTEAPGIEDSIAGLLLSKPELLGSKLQPVTEEFDTGSGVVDLLFIDAEGAYVLVELKETADQETVGQVLKQSNGMKSKLGISTMRKVIVALRTSGKVADACKASGIELYLISAERHA